MKGRNIPALALSVLLSVLLASCGGGGQTGAGGGTAADGTASGPADMQERPLTEKELADCEEFLNQVDCYGFLLSDYTDPLDADLSQVFYTGAGVGETPTQEMVSDYLAAMGYDEAYTDITFVSAKAANQVLVSRTGYALAQYQEHGNSIFGTYLKAWDGYFHMAGDTNRIQVKCTAGKWYPDGSLLVESQEAGLRTYGDDGIETDYRSAFRTALIPGGDGWQFGANVITGGWLRDYYDELEDYGYDETGASAEPMTFTAQAPCFDQWYTTAETLASVLPVTLTLVSERNSNTSSVEEWTAAHWDAWMQDTTVFERMGSEEELSDRDVYLYEPGVGTNGAYLNVYEPWTGAQVYADCDFTSFLYPGAVLWEENAPPADLEHSARTAQSVRWVRQANDYFFVSTFHNGPASDSAGMNGYVTCLDNTGAIRWRTDPLVCNSRNFELLGVENGTFIHEGVLICGYGYADEENWLYQINLETGQTLDRMALDGKPEALVYANGRLYVHCTTIDYEFDVSFG